MDRSEIDRLAREAGIEWQGGFVRVAECVTQPELERFAALVAAAEREACAQLCDQMEQDAEGTDCCKWPTPADCAYAIRTRSKE